MCNRKKILFYFLHPKRALINLLYKYSHLIKSDKLYIVLMYLVLIRKYPNINSPKTFTEKLQWIKLYDRKPIYHKMVDKVDVKEYIESKIGKGFTIPTIGVWNNFDDIDFSLLPDQFILKCTHDSGSYSICKDKREYDFVAAKNKVNHAFKKDYYLYSREWPYKGLTKRILVEPLLKDNSGGDFLRDYKFYCFNGIPKFLYITSDRGTTSGLKEDFFYINGERCEFSQKGESPASITPSFPKNISEMIRISQILSEDTYHLRVDFYEINDKIYVGELTFFDGGGFVPFNPNKYNSQIGDWIKLPVDKQKSAKK